MSLAISHDIYNGSYDSFNEWRLRLAKMTNRRTQYLKRQPYLSPITGQAELFTGELITVSHEDLNNPAADDATMGEWLRTPDNPLEVIFLHRDAEGYIYPVQARPVADALEALLPRIPPNEKTDDDDNVLQMTQNFINGLRRAADANERVVFA